MLLAIRPRMCIEYRTATTHAFVMNISRWPYENINNMSVKIKIVTPKMSNIARPRAHDLMVAPHIL